MFMGGWLVGAQSPTIKHVFSFRSLTHGGYSDMQGDEAQSGNVCLPHHAVSIIQDIMLCAVRESVCRKKGSFGGT